MRKATVISLATEFEKLKVLLDRKPESGGVDGWFAELASHRDGGIFITHWAGRSEWERHPNGDEVVFVIDGETTLVLLMNREEVRNPLTSGELLVIPKETWHRFESARPVKVLTVTPQPTDHFADLPEPGFVARTSGDTGARMIDHFNLPVSDLERSRSLYERVLAPLGYSFVMQDGAAVGFGRDSWEFGILAAARPIQRLHVAFRAPSRQAVDEFFSAALAGGAVSNGDPGLRPDYSPTYYAAFVIDPDGHNVEAVHRG